MFENWFTNKCTAFVNNNGRMLDGIELENADNAVKSAEQADMKVWTDKDGVFYVKKRSLFASAEILCDKNGNPVRICNHRVNTKARFCSKCGAPAPGGWWKCSGCGKYIGNESKHCPHCGKPQSVEGRQNFSNGTWLKKEEVVAEYIDLEDAASMLNNGLSVLSNQCCAFFAGGKFIEILESGSYSSDQLTAMAAPYGGSPGIVMIDKAEFPVRMNVEKIRSSEDIEADLHITLTLRLDVFNINTFLLNFMGKGLALNKGSFANVVTYDEIVRTILQFADLLVREFCATKGIKEFFCSADTRKELEDYIQQELFEHLKSAGMSLIRLGEVEFESEVFDKLREKSGEIETKRQELEFLARIRELETDTRRQELLKESEMEELVREFAKEKRIKGQLFAEEMEELQKNWELKKAIREIELQGDINDTAAQRESQSRLLQFKIALEEQNANHEHKLAQRRQQQEEALQELAFDAQLTEICNELALKKQQYEFELQNNQVDQELKVDLKKNEHFIKINKMNSEAELEIAKQVSFTSDEIRENAAMTDLKIVKAQQVLALEGKEKENKIALDRLEKLVAIKNMKNEAKKQQNIEFMKAAEGVDITALLAGISDPGQRKHLLELYALLQKKDLSPEQLLAESAAQGNREAAEALRILVGNKKNNADK